MNITELYKLTALREIDELARGAMLYVDENTSVEVHIRLEAISDIAACAMWRDTKKEVK
jgi:hypothetical protein